MVISAIHFHEIGHVWQVYAVFLLKFENALKSALLSFLKSSMSLSELSSSTSWSHSELGFIELQSSGKVTGIIRRFDEAGSILSSINTFFCGGAFYLILFCYVWNGCYENTNNFIFNHCLHFALGYTSSIFLQASNYHSAIFV